MVRLKQSRKTAADLFKMVTQWTGNGLKKTREPQGERELGLTKSFQDAKSARNKAGALPKTLQTYKPAESSKTECFELRVPKADNLSSRVAQQLLRAF